ncbi:MAG: tRNA uridine-5-carboxymethylaminomethyl(34) synthesis GTPase MnmE [Tissierellia bacterium]|nr:tRNA uridine-5-carboxymethylaminomethyl(34) synthesis GTPase MnmE [Tissierellia bacterium]
MVERTIAAISTPMGTGGISIVRMSGNESFNIIKKIFVPANGKAIDTQKDNRKMRYGKIIYNDEEYDEVMVCLMKAPYTYTCENVVEINCHGSMISVKKILNLLLDLGCDMAEPGEFTKRAFLNGRIDLSQAEAVIDIINATGEIAQKEAINQLNGSVKEAISDIRKTELEALSRIEYSINFTEDGEDLPVDDIIEYIECANEKIDMLKSTANKGKIIRDGVETALIGKPNVGKSSLLNALLKENRAIVTDIAGTTRDAITEYLNLGNLTLKINDTAGIRETGDIVEKIGVEKSIEILEKSDLIIAIFDSSRELDNEDQKILSLIEDKNAIIILNKSDLERKFERSDLKTDLPIIEASIKNNEGLDKIEKVIMEIFDTTEIEHQSTVITNLRHERLLEKASVKLKNCLNDIKMNVPIDCVEVDLRSSYNDLGEITGDEVSDEILDKVFKEFCVGK